MRMVLIAIAALLVVGGAGYYVVAQQQARLRLANAASEPVVAAPTKTDVFVPSKDLSAGVILKPEHLARLALDPSAVSGEMVVADEQGETLLIGSVARQSLVQGLPIARSTVVQPGDRGFLAAVLPQGKRAISIPITETAGVSGLAMPGDRVDIILTYSLSGEGMDIQRDVRASETLLANIRVLAFDQRLDRSQPEDGTAAGAIARTATLQVSPREAEMITLATTLGDLSMVLNSVHDGGEEAAAVTDAAAADLLLVPGSLAPARSLTIDSDVTSLLRRDAPAEAPDAEGISGEVARSVLLQRIQIVRGTTSGAVDLAEQTEAAPAGDAIATDTATGPAELAIPE